MVFFFQISTHNKVKYPYFLMLSNITLNKSSSYRLFKQIRKKG